MSSYRSRQKAIRRGRRYKKQRSRRHVSWNLKPGFGKLLALMFLGSIGAVGLATSVGAYFTSQGSGTGSAAVTTLNPPTNVIATFPNPDVRTVDVNWTAPTEPSGIALDGYYVQRFLGAVASPVCDTSPTTLISTLTCDDTNVPSNTYTYTVTAVFRSWTATSEPSGPVTVPAPQLTSLILAPSTSTPTAGTAFTVGITAYDQYGEIDTAYTGSECLTFTGPAISPDSNPPKYPVPGGCSSGSEVTFDNGISTGGNSAVIILFDAQAVPLTATDNPTSVDGTTDLVVSSAPISTFEVANPGPQMVGAGFGDTITAVDGYGNTVTGYSGPQILDFSGPSDAPNTDLPTYPGSVDFTLGVGDATGIILVDAQTTTLTATQSSISGTSMPFVVSSAPISTFEVANPGPQMVGAGFGDTITAVDGYGNTVTGYSGPQILDFSGPSDAPNTDLPTYPGSVDFTLGVGDATGIILVDAQTTTLTATQSSISGTSMPFVVSAGPADHYVVTAPSTATVSVPFNVSISAYDIDGNPVTGYDGTAELVSSLGNVLPTSITLVNGTVSFSATLDTAGNQTITATDSVNPSISGVSGIIDVSGGTSATYTVTYLPGSATSGSVPVDSNAYAAGNTVTVRGNTGSLAESGYTFTGWNTKSDGSGTSYAPGATFTISANTSLYAVFTANTATYTVTYLPGSATSGSVPVDSNAYAAGNTVTVRGNTGSLAESGYTFTGWNTKSDGSGTSYAPGATFTISANTSLYAVFTANTATYTVTYLPGSATSGSVPVDSNAYAAGNTVTVRGNTGSLAESGYTFTGWNTKSDGSGTSYAPGATFTISANTSLYAVFTANTATYTVTYLPGSATSGSVPVDSNAYAAGNTVTVRGNTGSLAESGYTFTGWNTKSDGSGTSYAPGATFTISANTSLYAVFTANTATYTVTYLPGSATSGSVPVDSNAYAAGNTVTVRGNTGSLAESGYTFTGWNTKSDGSGTSYAPGATFTISANTSLYAVFTANTATYTVTYLPGSATSGSVPVDSNAYAAGNTVTVRGNTGSLAESGYTFTGWNTKSDGSGTSYAPGATFTISANTSLYAVFTANTATYTVTYLPGSATSGSVPVDSNAYAAGNTVTVRGNTGSLAESGYTFTGWNTKSDGSGTSYAPGATFTISANTSLYAVFTANTATYTVTYLPGSATSGSVPVDSNAYAAGNTVTVRGNTGSLAESGYTFTGWNTKSDGSGTSYAPGATFTISANTSLYAVFTANTATYTVTYLPGSATSGSVPVDSNAYAAGNTVTVRGNTGSLAESGYTFTGWNTKSDGSGTSYAPGATFTISANTSLYAVFTANTATYTVTYLPGSATSGSVPVDSNAYAAGNTVTVRGNTGSLAESGYTFTGWNTKSDGSGTSYAPGATFTISANTSLYAMFLKNLVITTTSLAGATAGENNYSQTLQGTGGTPPYTWSISVGMLPKGLSINPSTGQISGNVSAWAVTETFTIELTDHNGVTTTKQFTITVTTPLVITTTSLAGATAGENNYSQTLQGTGGTPPYTWSISVGMLPKGLSINPSTGQISGNVSAWAVTETFTIELTDHNGVTTTKQFTITVNSRPVFTCGDSDHGSRGHSYRFQFTTWGDPDQTFQESGKLPEGLFFDDHTGLIWGTPDGGAAGNYNFTITADNSWGSSSLSFNLKIS